MPKLQPIVRIIDENIRSLIPDPKYAIKWKKVYYGLPELGWVIEMVAYDVTVNLVFHGGVDFDPPPPLGDSDRSRYIKLDSTEEANTPRIREWIKQATTVPGWK
jgi:hypothetical protein